MKETTRQLVLLLGVLTLLTSTLVLVNYERNSSTSENSNINTSQPVENENNSLLNGSDTERPSNFNNSKDSNESKSLITQAIEGNKQLYSDLKAGVNALLSLSNSSDGS